MNLGISATEFVSQAKAGTISVEEFVAKTLDRIKLVEEKVHAFITVDSQNALAKAKEIDKKIKSKDKVGICFGMPVSIKDNICTAGMKTTCASKMLENFVAPYDATVVSRLKSEDAIIVGKVNLDEFAMGSTTEFSYFGTSRNPWNVDYVPGGSSGGSGVSVSALECLGSLGSDTGAKGFRHAKRLRFSSQQCQKDANSYPTDSARHHTATTSAAQAAPLSLLSCTR